MKALTIREPFASLIKEGYNEEFSESTKTLGENMVTEFNRMKSQIEQNSNSYVDNEGNINAENLNIDGKLSVDTIVVNNIDSPKYPGVITENLWLYVGTNGSDDNELENTPDSKIKIVKVRINENEYLKLKKLALSEFLNVSRYIKFLISQKIYTDTNPANSQINEINQIRKDLLKIGVNINSIAKKINTDNYASNDLLNLLSETLKDIQKQDNTIKLKINSFASINKDRF